MRWFLFSHRCLSHARCVVQVPARRMCPPSSLQRQWRLHGPHHLPLPPFVRPPTTPPRSRTALRRPAASSSPRSTELTPTRGGCSPAAPPTAQAAGCCGATLQQQTTGRAPTVVRMAAGMNACHQQQQQEVERRALQECTTGSGTCPAWAAAGSSVSAPAAPRLATEAWRRQEPAVRRLLPSSPATTMVSQLGMNGRAGLVTPWGSS